MLKAKYYSLFKNLKSCLFKLAFIKVIPVNLQGEKKGIKSLRLGNVCLYNYIKVLGILILLMDILNIPYQNMKIEKNPF